MRRIRFTARSLRVNLVAAAVASCFSSANLLANPTGHAVVNGSVSMATPLSNQLHITNSPNAIIHWQGFSIGADEVTRFIQQSPASAVLNRVVTNNPSEIFGQLLSNGRVFLINPNGIVFGQGSVVDVAGLVASSLNLTDANFLSGKYLFDAVPGAGRVDNFGSIQAGQVYLVGPAVSNGGLIASPQGEVVLAAGNSVELMNTGTPGLSVSISAGAHEALNLGSILADSGRVGIFAGLVTQAGSIQANAAVAGADGSIKLVATGATAFTTGSFTIASGSMDVTTGDLTVAGNVQSGPQTINATGAVLIRNEPGMFTQLLAFGGQTINARSLEVAAQGGGGAFITNRASGDQRITVAGGGSSPGIDVRSLSSGGFANISNHALGAAQTIAVTDADHININGTGDYGASINAIGGTQTISITGTGANAIKLGSTGARGSSEFLATSQYITAGRDSEAGSITIIGSDGNGRFAGISSQRPGGIGDQTVSTSGTLSLIGGNAVAQATNTPAGLFHNQFGQQRISANQIVLQAGSSGSNNSARIGAANGPQRIDVGEGGLQLIGGSGGEFNQALISAGLGPQTITSAGSASLTAGTGGAGNYAVIAARQQDVTVTGNLTLSGGSSLATPTAGAGALIGGGNLLPTNLTLTVGGDVTLNGGIAVNSGAAFGTGSLGVHRTDITLNVGGNVTLNPGAGTGTRIGSRPDAVGGGEIIVNAGGTIALNGAGPGNAGVIRTADGVTLQARDITQGADSTIQANTLTINTMQDASLLGTNSVNNLSALVSVGDLAFNNTSPLLTVTGAQVLMTGSLTLNQAGDLQIPGFVFSGPQAIRATGGLIVQNEPGGFAALSATGGQTIEAAFVEVNAVAGGSASISNFGGDQFISTTGANNAGEGLAVRAFDGGAAVIDSPQGEQSIIVRNAERMVVGGGNGLAYITAFGMPQSIVLTGADANALVMGGGTAGQAIILGGNQTVQAGQDGESGSITLLGNSAGFSTAIIANQVEGGTQTIGTPGALTVAGGTAPTGFDSGIFADGLQQSVNAGSIALTGGASGSSNGAVIWSNTPMQRVVAGSGGITVTGGTGATNNDAGIYANSGSQVVEAGAGGITLIGGSAGSSNFAQINQVSTNPLYTQSVQSAGPVLLEGGSGDFNFARIRAFGGHQDLTLGDITLLGGAVGANNFAQINAINGPQQVNAGSILLVGGTEGLDNNALLRSGTGPQTIAADQVTLKAGTGGTANFAAIVAPLQDITVHGDVTLTGGSSLSSMTSGGGALIGGGANLSTNLLLTVGGNVTLTGGSVVDAGTGIGSSSSTIPQRTDITMNVQGDLTLNPGAVTGSRIGTRPDNVGGGEIVVNAGGTIALNSAAPGNSGAIRTLEGVTLRANRVTQGVDSQIHARSLTVETAQGASLVGDNQVVALNALNATSGNVAFNNTSALLTVAGIDQVPTGALSLNQDGSLLITGEVTSGAQTIGATGDMTIAAGDGPGITVQALGGQTFTVGGSFSLLGGTAWNSYARTLAHGPVSISTGADLNVRGGSGLLAYALLYGGDGIRLTVGDELHVDGGSGLLAFARVQTGLWDKIFLDFPNRDSGGYFVDGREGVAYWGLDGFFTGLLPARPGRSLVVTYGQ